MVCGSVNCWVSELFKVNSAVPGILHTVLIGFVHLFSVRLGTVLCESSLYITKCKYSF